MKRLVARIIFIVGILVNNIIILSGASLSALAQNAINSTSLNTNPFGLNAIEFPPFTEWYNNSFNNENSGSESLLRLFSNRLTSLKSTDPGKDNVVITKIDYSETHAYALVQEIDPETRKVISDYSFLLLATKDGNNQWIVVAPSNSERDTHNILLAGFPERLIDEASKAYYHSYPRPAQSISDHKDRRQANSPAAFLHLHVDTSCLSVGPGCKVEGRSCTSKEMGTLSRVVERLCQACGLSR